MYSRKQLSYMCFLKLVGFVLWTGGPVYAQCPSLKAIMVNPCGDEIRNEFMILDSGTGFNTEDLQISFDLNSNGGGRQNNDININIGNFSGDTRPCRFQPGNASLVTGCDNVQVVSQGEEIPPNAIVIIQMSGDANEPIDFSYLCGTGECVYVLQNDCVRTLEAFHNQGSGSRSTLIALSNTQCNTEYTYNRGSLVGGDGAFYAPQGTSLYENRGCGVTPPVSGGTIPPEFVNPGNLFGCETFTLPAVTGMHLTGGERYYTGPYGTGVSYSVGAQITRSTTLFIYDRTAPCSPLEMFRVNILDPVTPNLIVPNPLCEQDIPYPLATTQDGIPGSWTGDGISNNLFSPNTTDGGVYTLTFVPDPDECAKSNSIDVTVLPTPVAATNLRIPACNGNGAGIGFFDLTAYASAVNGGTHDQVFWYEDVAQTMLIEDSTAYSSASGLIYAVVDNGACLSNPAPVELRVGRTPTVSFKTIKNLSCFGDTDGGIEIEISGGTPPYQIEWSDPTYNGQTNLTDLAAGTYAFTVTDDQGCFFSQSATLIEPSELMLVCNKLQDVGTVIGKDGTASFTASGGVAPYWVVWEGPELDSALILTANDTLVVDTLRAGTYQVRLRDALGCVSFCQIDIDAPNCDLEISPTFTNPSCFDSADGSIQITATGAQGNLSYTWNTSALNGQAGGQNLPAGRYEVSVTDETGCQEIASILLEAPTMIDLNCSVQNSVTVLGGSDGRARIQVSGGTPPYTATWTGPRSGDLSIGMPTDFLIENLPAGDYNLQITDAEQCEQFCSFTIADGNCSGALDISVTNESCPNTADGRLQLDLIGSWIAPVQYDWDQDAFDGQFQLSDLAAGTYSVTVTGANSCQASISATVGTEFSLPEISFVQNAQVCLDDCYTFDLNFSGTPPFFAEFILRNGNQSTTMNVNADQPTETLTICPADHGISSGSLRLQLLRVSDANCINEQAQESIITILESTEADFTATLCPNESVTINGQTYDFNRSTGTEILSGANEFGCDSIVHIDLRFDQAAILEVRDTLCRDGSISINGQIYDINRPSGSELVATNSGCDSIIDIDLSFYPPAIGQLELTVCPGEERIINGTTYNAQNPSGSELFPGASVNGCDSILEIRLIYLEEVVGFFNETICPSDEIVINGTTYDFEHPNGMEVFPGAAQNGCDSILQIALNFHELPTGTFNETICPSDEIVINGTTYDFEHPNGMEVFPGAAQNGCDSILQIALNFHDLPTGTFNETICPSDEVVINGTTYNFDHPSGMEVFPGAAQNGCDSILQIALNFHDLPTGTFNETICPSDEIIINGTTYNFEHPSGMEVFPGVAQNGCDSLLRVELNFYDLPTGIFRDTLCPDGSLLLNGTTYDIDHPNGTEVLPGLAANGCDSLVQVELTFLEDVTVAIVGDQDICQGEDAVLEFQVSNALSPIDIQYTTNGGNPTWIYGVMDGDQLTVSPGTTTTYSIVQAQVPPDFCTVTIGGEASVRMSALMVDAVTESDYFGYGVSCADQRDGAIRAVVMAGTGPFEFIWQDGVRGPVRTNLGAGMYSVLVTDAFGCTAEALVQLEPPPPLQMQLSSIPLDCGSGLSGAILIDTVIGGNPPYFFSLNGNAPQALLQFPLRLDGLAAGRHAVEIIDEFGCNTTQEVVIIDFSPLELILGPDQEIRYGESVRLDGVANFQIDSLFWTPTDSLYPSHTLPTMARPSTTTTYKLTAFDSRGCAVSDEIRVTVTREDDIYIPNAFSPNHDGINDRVYPFTNPNIKIIDEFRVFDRWGNQMHFQQEFQGNQEKFGWDGVFNNQPMDPAVFIFVVQFTYLDGKKGMIKGDVTLVR